MPAPWERYADAVVVTPADNGGPPEIPDNAGTPEAVAAASAGPWSKYSGEKARLDKELTTENYRVPGTDVRVPHTSALNQFLVSTGRGMVDLWAGANQIVRTGESAKEYTRQQQEDVDAFKPMQEEAPVISTVGRIVGQMAPSMVIPAGAAASGVQAIGRAAPALSMLSKAGVGTDAAIQGGLLGFMNFAPEGESRGVNALTGAVTAGTFAKGAEMAGRVAGPSISRGIDWVADKAGYVGKSDLASMAGTKSAASADDLASALKSEGIDWMSLPSQVRDKLLAQADEAARAGAPVTPAELARVVRAENLPGGPARLTKGQMTQNRTQLRDEFNLRSTRFGQSLDDQLVAQDKALADSLDVIKLKTGGRTTAGREAEAGQKITAPLLEQLKGAQAKVDALYKAADQSGETLKTVSPEPLIGWLEDNFAAQHSAPAMKSLAAQLKKAGLVQFSKDGESVTAVPGREMTIREAESLRQAMNQWGKGSDASGHWMGEAKRVLDGMTEGKGGDLYAKARAARIDLRNQFEDPGVINRLVGEKAGGDRVTPFEDVFSRTVLNGSVDDLTTLRGQLLKPAERTGSATAKGAEDQASALDLRDSGTQAFKDLRAATLDYIKLGATSNAKDEFSYAGLKRAVDKIGPEKLEVLFGKNTANQILSVVESAKDMKAVYSKSGIYNPGTASAGMDWLANVLDKITGIVGLGKAGTYGRVMMRGGVEKMMETLHAPRQVEAASKPVESAMRAGVKAQGDAYARLMGLYAGRAGTEAGLAAASAAVAPEGERR
jgi:hypothetical protein